MEAILSIIKKIKFLHEVWNIPSAYIIVFEAWGFKASDTNLIKTAGLESEGESTSVNIFCN